MALFSKFFGRTISDAAGFALGGAMRSPLEPPLVELTNETWARFVEAGITVPTDPGDAAEIAAEDVASEAWAKDQAKQRGYGGDQMDKLISAVRNAPGLETLYALWRRGLISDGLFVHGLNKARLEEEWNTPLEGLHDTLLSSEELAMMQQQGFIEEGRANSEGALQGVTEERQQLRFEASGLPPGIETGLEMLRRGIIDAGTFAQIVREGHTKTKYTGQLLALRDRVLSAATYATLALKGWITQAEMHDGGALTGYSPAQMDLLFKEHGRPATTHQVWIGLQRGGKYIGENLSERETFDRAIIQSDIRPEWADLLWAQRYTYPTAFVLRQLTSSGALTQAQAATILKYEGWEPTLADQVAAKWAQPSSAASKEATATDLLTLYEGGKATRAETLAALEALGYPADEAATKVDVLEARRVVSAKTAAISDLHGAFKKGAILGTAAQTALEDLGLDAATATAVLNAWRVYLAAEAASAPPAP